MPADRYGSVALLREDLARWLEHRPLTLARPGLAYTLNRFVRIADGPDEVHMSQLGKQKIKEYVAMNER